MASTIRGNDNFDTAGGNAVKAWVNFNGTGTVAIRASYNVSSITDNGTGDYTVNFTTALSDANYVVNIGSGNAISGGTYTPGLAVNDNAFTPTTSAVRMISVQASNGTFYDPMRLFISILR